MHAAPLAARRSLGWPRAISINGWACLQGVLLLVSVVQFFRCSGPAYFWVALALAVPAARWLVSASYQVRVRSWLRSQSLSIERFATDRARLPWRATAWLIVLPVGIFFLTQGRPLMTGDSKPITLIASALVRDGTTDLDAFTALYAPYYRATLGDALPYFCERSPSGVHSRYHSATFVFALPSAFLARCLGVDLVNGGVQDRMEKGVASWLAAVCLGLFFLIALHLTDATTAALMTLLLTIGSGLCSTTGQALWQHGGVLFAMLSALLMEFRTWRRPRRAATMLQGAALAFAFACRLPSAILIFAFLLWLIARTPRRALFMALSAGLGYLPWAWYYQTIYRNPLGPSIRQVEMFTGCWRDTLLPLLVSPDHGLLVYQPWILLCPATLLPRFRGQMLDAPCGWAWFCIGSIIPYVGLVASWYCWWGGQCWGSRLLVETVPFFALLCLPPLATLRHGTWGRRMIWAMALLAAFVQLPGVYLKVDFRDTQPALFGTRPEPPGSWKHLPFLTPFVGAYHGWK